MTTETETKLAMPMFQKAQLRAMDDWKVCDFQIKLQVQCGLTVGDAADYIAQAYK